MTKITTLAGSVYQARQKNEEGYYFSWRLGYSTLPRNKTVCKQLLPVYDKPLIYYSFSILMLSEITDILIISSPRDIDKFKALFGDGADLGINIKFQQQKTPAGIAEALILAETFLEGCPSALILGDNIFFGNGLSRKLQKLSKCKDAVVFSYQVNSPEAYGVIEVDENGLPISIQEKPIIPKSTKAVTGLYFYPSDAPVKAHSLSPSSRGELEITDLNEIYLRENRLTVEHLGRGYAWLDAGTEEDLLEASNFIATFEKRQGVRIGCIEEIAWRMGLISLNKLKDLGENMSNSGYGQYLIDLATAHDENY